jgi:hypothetical protein
LTLPTPISLEGFWTGADYTLKMEVKDKPNYDRSIPNHN